MNNLFKTILIASIALLGAGVLFISSTQATEPMPSLIVEYWSETGSNWLPLTGPIFSETNFLPGDGVTRLIRVTNNSVETQRIATEAINKNDLNNFASQMNLTIKESATVIFNNTLAQFFSQGETYLSSLASGVQTQYDFTITFNPGSENYYQGKTLGFYILVGFEGTEGGLPLPSPGAGTSGGGLPLGLTIQDESVKITTTTEFSVTIIWTTSYLSTSQVIYGTAAESHTLDLTDNVGTPPKYGYAHTTPESNVSPKVTSHSVTVSGLNPNTTYYFRAVSHASLAISREFTFTTLGVKEIGEIGEEIPSEGIPYEEEISAEEVVLAPTGEEEVEKPEGFVPEGAVSPEEGIVTVPPGERAPGEGLGPLLLASVGVIGETPWMAILAILCLIGLVVIGIREWELARKKKKSKF